MIQVNVKFLRIHVSHYKKKKKPCCMEPTFTDICVVELIFSAKPMSYTFAMKDQVVPGN